MIREITANARISFKQPTRTGDVFYTFEYGETRSVDEFDIEKQKNNLWEAVNNEVNKQIIDVRNLYSTNHIK